MATRECGMPRVSVGVPVFNGERYLEDALRSIQRQTMEDIEIIVSDNASTDRTAEIVLDLGRDDKRIRYYRQKKNIGAAENYNWVFKNACAPYFRWAPADDLMAPNLLERCVSVLEEELDTVIAYPRTELIDAYGKHLSFYKDNLNLSQEETYKRATAYILKMNLCNAVCGVHRSSALKRTSLIRGFQDGDAVLLFEIILHGKVREVDEPLYLRRVHNEASVEANRSAAAIQSWFDPKQTVKRFALPNRLRLLVEYLSVISRFPASLEKRIFVGGAVLGVWSYRNARVAIGRWRRKLIFPHYYVAADTRFPDLDR